jgi:hypothetical protein
MASHCLHRFHASHASPRRYYPSFSVGTSHIEQKINRTQMPCRLVSCPFKHVPSSLYSAITWARAGGNEIGELCKVMGPGDGWLRWNKEGVIRAQRRKPKGDGVTSRSQTRPPAIGLLLPSSFTKNTSTASEILRSSFSPLTLSISRAQRVGCRVTIVSHGALLQKPTQAQAHETRPLRSERRLVKLRPQQIKLRMSI